MKFIISDLLYFIKHLSSYIYWNRRGIRVSLTSFCSKKAFLDSCSVFGRSKVLDGATIGKHTYLTDSIIQHADVGEYCSIAPGVKIGLEEHDISNYSTHPSTYDYEAYVRSKGRVKISNHVWLGANVIVLQGVKVGEHSVVAAGAVVTKDIPDHEIWGGCPARFISRREVVIRKS